MMDRRPTLWIYEAVNGWFAHIDWQNGAQSKREGPFKSEAQAETVMSRMYTTPAKGEAG